MWFLLLLLHVAHIQPAISQDDAKRLVLRNDGNNPCEGHVEVFYKKKLGVVGDKFWNQSTEEVVCRSTYCGKPVEGSIKYVRRPKNSIVWLNELKCNGKEEQLWECSNPGWGISYYPKPIVKKITCSRNITFELDGPSRCAGAVRYLDGGKPAGYICSNNWNEGSEEANRLCKYLGCGKVEKIPTAGQMSGEAFLSGKSMKIDCAGLNGTNNLWQCAAPDSCQNPAAVICSGHTRLRLAGRCSGKLEKKTNGKWEDVKDNDKDVDPDAACKQMHCGSAPGNVMGGNLTCTDEVKVVLENDNKELCYGRVNVERNGVKKPVCGSSNWEKQAEVVCKELGCGTVISVSKGGRKNSGIMDMVECSGNETSLWHCEAKHGENLQCLDVPYVVCSASLEARLKDGGGRCAGRLEIKYDGQWKGVQNGRPWTDDHSDIICKQLECGNGAVRDNTVKYSDGSGDFLTVDCGSNIKSKKNINECKVTQAPRNSQSVEITCEGHEVLFLSGSCSGKVGIKRGSETFWLSNASWTEDVANTVCRQMHCGNAASYNAGSKLRADKVWFKSYKCSGNEKSLFHCDNTTIDVLQNASIASVTCSGKIQLQLTRGCWGNVAISMEGEKPGGICADTWTDSEKLCKELEGCGDKALESLKPQRNINVMVLSLHPMQSTANLSQYNFIMMESDSTCRKPASVVCSGSVKPRFSASRDSCSGNVELSYEDQWLPVCTEALTANAQNTICQALGCGKAGKKTDDFGPTPASRQVIANIQCSTNATSLEQCNVTSKIQSCTLGILKCSEWKTMVIEHDEPCKGEVVVYSEGKVSAISNEGWSTNEHQKLCHDMACGSPIQFNYKTFSWPTDSFINGTFNCTGEHQSIWECEKKVLPSKMEKLSVDCRNEAQVNLSQGCHGELRINNTQVCSSQWNLDYSNKVCQELSCSNAVSVKEEGKLRSEVPYHIRCDEYHYKLDQCRRVRGNCNSEKSVEIVCVDSIKFKTTETCGGKIQVLYRDEWKKVYSQDDLSQEMKHQLCQKMGCGNHEEEHNKYIKDFLDEKLEMNLECTADHLDIRHCIKKKEEDFNGPPAQIYCEAYEPPSPPPPPPSNLPMILGVSFLLVLLIVGAVGARFYFIRRNRKLMRMFPDKEPEFESGEYEDVINGDNEIEDVRGGRFRSDDEFFREDDRRSASSLPYDDIDEAAEAQPLNPPVNSARAGNMQEDKVTYEVEDPLENYDDIESGPETTKAEVHDGPQPTADRDAAAAPPGPGPGNEDYLVPGQEG